MAPQLSAPYRGEPIHYEASKNIVEKAKRIYSKRDIISVEDFQDLPDEKRRYFQPVYLDGLEEVEVENY